MTQYSTEARARKYGVLPFGKSFFKKDRKQLLDTGTNASKK